jgi:hypothetical protein
MNQSRSSRISIILFFVIVFSFFATSVSARQTEDPTVEVFRMNGLYVIIKITFPTEISGSFAGTLAGKHFDCVTLPPSTLICMGSFRVGPDYATLTIYDQDTKENILVKALKSPPSNGIGEQEDPIPVKEEEEEEPCSEQC